MTLGQVLKNQRFKLGKSIEQIATATRIHVKVLKALEDDHYGELPARAFTRGFIIAYCKALQLNSDEILRDYHDFLESKFSERPEKDHGHHGYAFEGKEMEQNKRWMIIIASSAAFFAILTLLFFKPQNHKHKEKHKELIEEAELAATTTVMNADGTVSSETKINTQTATSLSTGTATNTAVSATTNTSISASTLTGAITAAAPTSSSKPTSQSVAAILATPTAKQSSPTPTATPIPSLSPSPSPATEATPKEDPLNKGDGMAPKDIGVKITLQAVEDTLIHYHSDQRKQFSIKLRKGKQLVIKASNLIRVETTSPGTLKYKLNFKNSSGGSFSELKEERLEIHTDGTQKPFDAGAL